MQEGEEKMEQNCLKKVPTRHCISNATNSHSSSQFGITITNKRHSQWMFNSSLFLCFCKENGLVKPTVVWFRWWHSVTNVVMSFPAVLSDRLILLSFLEQSQVAAVYLSQKNQDSPETSRRTDKMSPSEIKVQWNLIRESAGALQLVCIEERKMGGGQWGSNQ